MASPKAAHGLGLDRAETSAGWGQRLGAAPGSSGHPPLRTQAPAPRERWEAGRTQCDL